MKKFLLAGAAVAALASGAQAADLGSRRVEVPSAIMAPAFSWTGFYVGAHVGYGSAQARYTDPSATLGNATLTVPGVFGGIQTGYNWQMNNFVFGVEADISGTGLNKTLAFAAPFAGDTYRASVPYFGSLRARAGFAADRALFYVTGGLGVAQFSERYFDQSANAGAGATFRSSTTRVGYTVGAGIEYAVTNNWTVKGEYLYYGFGDRRPNWNGLNNDRLRTDVHTFKLGVNYLFSTGPSAVVARY